MNEGKTNNITKLDSFSWLKDNRKRFNTDYNARRIFEITVLGSEYDSDYGRGVSSLCRAYSITEYGSNKNRIRNVYKKYRNEYSDEELRQAIYTIVSSYPSGIQNEYPFFENKLKELLVNNNISDELRSYSLDRNTINTNNFNEQFSNTMNFSNTMQDSSTSEAFSPSNDQVLLIITIAAIIAVIIFHKQVFSLIASVIPYLIGFAVVYLIFNFVTKANITKVKNNKKYTSKNSFSVNVVSKSKESTGKPFYFSALSKPSGMRIIAGIAWAAMFLYAADYYINAGDPFHWTVIAAIIGIVGGFSIMFRQK